MLRSFSKRRGSAKAGMPIAFLASVAIAAGAYILCAFIATLIADATEDPTGCIGIAALCSLIVSGVLGGAVNSRLRGASGFVVALLAALCTALAMMIASLVITGGVSPAGLMNAVSYMGGSAVGAFIGKPRAKRRRARR